MTQPSPSWFHALPLYQKQELWAWLTTGGEKRRGIQPVAAARRLTAEFGITITASAIFIFRQRNLHRSRHLKQKS